MDIKKITLLSLLLASQANASNGFIGIDALYSKSGYKTGFGKDIFTKTAPAANVFAGYMFNQNFGVEIGHERQHSRFKKNVRITTNGPGLGQQTGLNPFFDLNSRTKQHHTYLGGVAKMQVFTTQTLASLMIGAAASHVKASYNRFNSDSGSVDDTRSFSKTKIIPLVRLSLEYAINSKINLRGLVGWKNTSSLKAKQQEASDQIAQIRLKDSVNFGIGIIFKV